MMRSQNATMFPVKCGTWKRHQHDAIMLKKRKLGGKQPDNQGHLPGAVDMLPEVRVRRRPPLKKSCTHGVFTEDRARCEAKGHRAKIYDDPEDDNGTQGRRTGRRTRKLKKERDRLKEEEGREEKIMVDLALRGRGDVRPDEANDSVDIVTEMLKELSMETIFVFTKWFQRRFRGECGSVASWRSLQLVAETGSSEFQDNRADVGDGDVLKAENMYWELPGIGDEPVEKTLGMAVEQERSVDTDVFGRS